MTNDKITVSRELLRQALQAHRAMREWIKAAPEPTISMPGTDGDWLDDVEGMLRNALEQQITQTGVGNSGFDYKTAADFLSGNEINDESVRRFVASSRWAHDDRASLQALVTTLRHDIATRDAEIALLKQMVLDTEALEQPAVEPVNFDQIAADRYKVVEAHGSLFHRWAVVAGDGTRQLYLGRELECQNVARKFAGAFLDGAWLASQHTAPQAQQPAEVPFLTDKEILEMADDGVFLGNVKEIARAVEAAVRKKAGLK